MVIRNCKFLTLPIYNMAAKTLFNFDEIFIHSKIYIAPLQGNYSEALPTPVRTKR